MPKEIINLRRTRASSITRDIAVVNGRLTVVRLTTVFDPDINGWDWDLSTWSRAVDCLEQEDWREDSLVEASDILIDHNICNVELLPKIQGQPTMAKFPLLFPLSAWLMLRLFMSWARLTNPMKRLCCCLLTWPTEGLMQYQCMTLQESSTTLMSATRSLPSSDIPPLLQVINSLAILSTCFSSGQTFGSIDSKPDSYCCVCWYIWTHICMWLLL